MVSAFPLVLLLFVAAVLTWLANDTQRVRRTIEGIVSAIADRPFSIEGEFDYELGRIVTVHAGKIRWRNSASNASPYMLEVEQFTGSFDLLSLFDWPLVITRVQARHATLLFEWDNQDGFNWRLGSIDTTRPKSSAPPDPLPLVIDQASVQDVSLRFRHPALTEELEVLVRQAQHQQDHAHRLVVSAVARLEDRDLSIGASIGPFPELAVAGAIDFDVVVAGRLAILAAAGKFARLAQLQGPELVAELKAPSATDLAKRLKLPLETLGRVQLHANVSTEGEGMVATAGGSFGEFEVDARFRSESQKSLQGLDVAVRSTGPSLRDLAAIAGLSSLPDAPYAFDARAQHTDRGLELQRFQLDTTGLNIHGSGIARAVSELRDLDLELTAAGSNAATVASLFDLDFKGPLPFELNAVVAGHGRGKHDAVDASLQLGSSTARVKGSISEAVDFSGSRLRFNVTASDAQQLAELAGIAAPAGATLQVRGSTSITAEQIRFEDVQAFLADMELNATAWLDRKPKQPGLTVEGQVKGADLAHAVEPLLPSAARSMLPQLPFAASAKLRLTGASLDIKTVSARVGSSTLRFRGQVEPARPGPNLVGEFSVRGENLAELLGGLGSDHLPETAFSLASRLRMSPDAIRFADRPFELSASLQGSGREQLIEELRFESGNSNLRGRLRHQRNDVPFLEIALTSSHFNLDQLLARDRPENKPQATVTGRDRLFSSDPLPFKVLDAFDAELSLQIDDLVSHQRRWRNLITEASLKQGVLDVRRVHVDAANGTLSARGTLKPTSAGRTITAQITAANAMLALEDMTKDELDRLPRHAIVAQLAATGNTPRALAASLDGFAWMIGGQGQVRRAKLYPLVGDFLTELLGAVNPFDKTKNHTRIDCQGMYFEIADGKVETAPAIAIQTEHVVVLAVGKVDLTNERIDFTFETTPLKGIGMSLSDSVAPLTKVVGTLSHPQIALNPKGALVQGGAAVATAGLTLLGKSMWKRWFGSRQICEKVADEALKIRNQRDPSAVPDLNKLLAGTHPPNPK
ncbi:MAG: hypothetical protein WA970_20565 [Gammaproteobacteria bacterium]